MHWKEDNTMRENYKISPRIRGRKPHSSHLLPSTVSNDRDEPKVHTSGGWASLYQILASRPFAISRQSLIWLALLSVSVMAWMGSNRLEFAFDTGLREDRVFPRYIRHLREEEQVTMERLDVNMEHYPSKRQIYVSPEALEAQEQLSNGGYYRRTRAEPFETDECKAQYDWQLKTFPSCNTLYEFDLTNVHAGTKDDEQVRLIANGYWRDVWMVKEGPSQAKRVLKTMRYEHDYVARNYDRHRRDALSMERLSGSPLVVDIYGFCGNSGLFEYADGGDISHAIWPSHDAPQNLTQLDKLEIATQAAMGVAAMHNVDKEGYASIAHTDITPGQFILIDGTYKLNDFNRARFIRWNFEKDQPCTYKVGNNPGLNRAPEEYEYSPQTEKVDIYSLGNIFYMLLTGLWPFEDISDEDKAHKMIASGKRPTMPSDIWNSPDAITRVIKEAMVMCHEQDPSVRATARKVESFLKGKLLEMEPNALASWGLA